MINRNIDIVRHIIEHDIVENLIPGDLTDPINIFTDGPQTLDETYKYVIGNSAGVFTINLPNAAEGYLGKEYIIKNIGAGTITLGSDVNIDNMGSVDIVQWQSLTVKLIQVDVTFMWVII